MEEVLTKLISKFPLLRFELCKPPQYLSAILHVEDEIIMCYQAKSKGKTQVTHDISNKTLVSTVLDETSCLGNPLEVPYSMEDSLLDLTLVEQLPVCHQCPLSSDDALEVKNYCNLEVKPTVPVVILCDVKSNNEVCRVLQVSCHNNGWISQSWADYYRQESALLPTLNQLLIAHSSKITGPNGKKPKYSMQLRCQSLLGLLEDVHDKSLTCSKVSVKFEWSEWSVKPPLDSITDASLIVDINLDRSNSFNLNAIWKQLVLLQLYVDTLENYENNSTKELHLPSAQNLLDTLGIKSPIVEADVSSRMNHLVLAPIEFYSKMTSLGGEQHKTLMKSVDFFSRVDKADSELTDVLWSNLIGCDSYQTLQNCFKEIFKIISYSRHTRPLRSTNISRLAHLLSSEQLMFVKCLDPLEYLVEIGIEKLRKELLSIFDSVHIGLSSLNMPSLPRFIELDRSERWLEVTKNWLLWLTQLYSSLNILLCIEPVLNSPQLPLFFPVVQEVVKRVCNSKEMYNSLSHLINNPYYSISLPISTEILKKVIPNTELFDDWSLTLRSCCENRKVTSIYSRSLFCKIPYILKDEDAAVNNTFLSNTTCLDVSVNDTNLLNNTCQNVSYLIHCIDSHCISDLFSLNL